MIFRAPAESRKRKYWDRSCSLVWTHFKYLLSPLHWGPMMSCTWELPWLCPRCPPTRASRPPGLLSAVQLKRPLKMPQVQWLLQCDCHQAQTDGEGSDSGADSQVDSAEKTGSDGPAHAISIRPSGKHHALPLASPPRGPQPDKMREPGRSCTGEQMTTTESSCLCVPGEHLLMFRPCSRAITTEPWRPDNLLIWRRVLCPNALVTLAFWSPWHLQQPECPIPKAKSRREPISSNQSWLQGGRCIGCHLQMPFG